MNHKTHINKPRAVLLLLQGMGNSLLTTPLIEVLAKIYLLDVITWRNGTERLLLKNPNIANIYSPKINTMFGLLKTTVKNKLFYYNAAFEPFPPGKRSHVLSFLSAKKGKYGYKIGMPWDLLLNNAIGIRPNIHDVNQNLRLMGVELSDANKEPTIYLSPEEIEIGKQTVRGCGTIGFHVGSGDRLSDKRWPAGHFSALMDMFHLNSNTALAMYGSVDEIDLMKECSNKCIHAKPLIIYGKPIRTIASCIKQCKLFISNDSGLMHVSSAMGTPTIGIFGPTDPKRTAPYGGHNKIIQTKLKCAPCYSFKGWVKCKNKQRCMATIKPEEVYDSAIEILKTQS